MIVRKKKGFDVRALIAATACTIVLTGCVSNGDAPNRIYAGAGYLVSQLEPDTDGVDGVSVDESDSNGFSLTFGADVSQNFSVEGYVADLGEADLSPAGSVAYQVGGISALLYGLNNVKDRRDRIGLSVFGRLGIGGLDNDVEVVRYKKVNDVHVIVGAGVEYGFDNGLAARAEINAHETDAKFAQFGFIYRFGNESTGEMAVPSVVDEPRVVDESRVVDEPRVEADTPAVTFATEPQAQTRLNLLQDTDSDGVPDAADDCPQTAAGLPVKDNGCEIFDGVVEGVRFETGSDTLAPQAISVLAGIAQTLRDYPDVKVAIESHTDNQGRAADNLQLSKRRAIAVGRFLVDQGIAGSRLRPQAFGESRPRVSNRTREGRAANRRVEFSIIN